MEGLDAEPARRLLGETRLAELFAKGPSVQRIVILKDTTSVDQALKVLASRKILSAPVVSTQGDASESGGYGPQWPADKPTRDILGFVDIRDILSSFLGELDVKEVIAQKMLQRMRFLETKGQSWALMPIKQLSRFGGDGDFLHTTQARISLRELIVDGLLEPKSRGLHGGSHSSTIVHRVAIFNTQGCITNIISQTDILRFVHQHHDQLGDISRQTVQELGFLEQKVQTVLPDVSAIEAMNVMNEHAISALPVVEAASGRIIGNFSVSDLRSIMLDHFGALSLPVGEFLALEHGTEFWGYSKIADEEVVDTPAHRFVVDRDARSRPRTPGRPKTPGEEVGQSLVLASPGDSFSSVLGKLVENCMHRVYVVDADSKPIGILTCTDILRKLIALTS